MISSNPSDSIDFNPTPGTTYSGIQAFLEEMYSRDSRTNGSTTPAILPKFDDISFAPDSAYAETLINTDQPTPPRTEVNRTDDGGTCTLEFAADGLTLSKSVIRDSGGKITTMLEYQADGKRLKSAESYDSNQKLKCRVEYDEKGGAKVTTLYENGEVASKTESGEDGRQTTSLYKKGELISKSEEGEKGPTVSSYKDGKLLTKLEPMPDGKGGKVLTKYTSDGTKDVTILYDKNDRATTYYKFGSNGKVEFEKVWHQDGSSSTTLYGKDGKITHRSGDSLLDTMLRQFD